LASSDRPVDRPVDRVVGRLAAAALYISFPIGFVGFLLPVYGRMVGASPFEVGTLYSVFSLTTVVLRPVVGRLTDRLGRRPFILAGLAVYAAAQLMMAVFQSYHGLLASRIIQGLGSSLFWLAGYAAVADVCDPAARGAGYGHVIAASARGGLLGALLGFGIFTAMGAAAGQGYEPRAMAVAFFVYFLIALWALWRTRLLPETHPAAPAAAGDEPAYKPGYPTLLGIVFLTASVQAVLAPVLILFLQDRVTRDVPLLAVAYVPAAVIWAILPARAGRLSDRVGRRSLMAVGLVAGAVVSAVLPAARSLITLTLLWVLEAGALSLAVPAEQALVSDLSGRATRGQAFGLYDLAVGLGYVVGPLAGTALYQAAGPTVPFYANAAGLVLAAALLLGARLGTR